MLSTLSIWSSSSSALAMSGIEAQRAFVDGLNRNIADHDAELAMSRDLGFERCKAVVPVGDTASYEVDRKWLGMGSACPFLDNRLVHASLKPIFTPAECDAVRAEAAALISAGARSSFTMTDTNRDVSVHEMPQTIAWLNGGAFARVTSLAAACFPGAVADATELFVYRGLVINYDAAAGLTHQPIHRDGSLVSCVVPLSTRAEYRGGGTYIEPLGKAIALEQGCALLHPSSVRHAGQRITEGERWVLVLFLNSCSMQPGEHGRRFRARAQEIFAEQEQAVEDGEAEAAAMEIEAGFALEEEEEDDEEAQLEEQDEEAAEVVYKARAEEEERCLLHALRACDETDHEVICRVPPLRPVATIERRLSRALSAADGWPMGLLRVRSSSTTSAPSPTTVARRWRRYDSIGKRKCSTAWIRCC